MCYGLERDPGGHKGLSDGCTVCHFAIRASQSSLVRVVASPGSCIRVSVPGLLLHSKGSLRQDGTEPGGDVLPDVIDLVSVLTRAAGAVLVGFVLQDLHPAALATAFLPALFLQDSKQTKQRDVDMKLGCRPRID